MVRFSTIRGWSQMPTSKKETVALKLLVLYLHIFVTSAYIPNLGPLGHSLPFEKFLVVVVVGGWWWWWWWWWLRPILVFSLVPS